MSLIQYIQGYKETTKKGELSVFAEKELPQRKYH
jgi:hypothetical protein